MIPIGIPHTSPAAFRVAALAPLKSNPFSSWGTLSGTLSVGTSFCAPINQKKVGPIWPHQGRGR